MANTNAKQKDIHDVRSLIENKFDGLKTSLEFSQGELGEIKKNVEIVLGLMKRVDELERQNEEKDNKIITLEGRINDLEQYSRINDIVVTGLKIKPQSYAKAAVSSGRGDVFNEEDNQSVEQQLIKFLQSNEILVNE